MNDLVEDDFFFTPEVPTSWATPSFTEVFEAISTNGKKIKQRDYKSSGAIPVVDQGEMFIGGYTDNEDAAIEAEGPLIVFGDHTRVFKFLRTKFAPGADGTKVLKPSAALDPKFAYLACKATRLPDKGYSRHFSFLKKTKVPLAPLNEQRRIVEKIETLFARLDKGEEALREVQKLLARYRQSVLKAAFSGNPRWEQRSVFEVCQLIDGDRGPNYPKRGDYKPQGFCLFLSTKNVRPDGFLFEELVFIGEAKHRQLRKGILSRNDIVITTRGTLGNVALYDDTVPFEVVRINSGMLILRLNSDEILPEYLLRFLMSPAFTAQIEQNRTGTAQPQLPAGILKNFLIWFPDPKEQKRLVQSFDELVDKINVLEAWCATELARSAALRQSILKDAFAGRLVPQDSADEPAAELLARIRGERESAPKKKAHRKARA